MRIRINESRPVLGSRHEPSTDDVPPLPAAHNRLDIGRVRIESSEDRRPVVRWSRERRGSSFRHSRNRRPGALPHRPGLHSARCVAPGFCRTIGGGVVCDNRLCFAQAGSKSSCTASGASGTTRRVAASGWRRKNEGFIFNVVIRDSDGGMEGRHRTTRARWRDAIHDAVRSRVWRLLERETWNLRESYYR
jgi:hypothetical protein